MQSSNTTARTKRTKFRVTRYEHLRSEGMTRRPSTHDRKARRV
jgi:hypothetical protein